LAAHEIADAAIIGTLLSRCEIAGRKLVHAAMIGDAFAAYPMPGTSRIGAVADL
jgi:hypothetical protein